MQQIKGRVLIGRYNLDGHDRGVMSVISTLRDAGIEVIYMLFSHPDELVKAALEEDTDVVGLTSSLGQHLMFSSLLIEGLKKEKADIPVIIGGIIPTVDEAKLLSIGVKQVFGPGSTPKSAASFVKKIVDEKYGQSCADSI